MSSTTTTTTVSAATPAVVMTAPPPPPPTRVIGESVSGIKTTSGPGRPMPQEPPIYGPSDAAYYRNRNLESVLAYEGYWGAIGLGIIAFFLLIVAIWVVVMTWNDDTFGSQSENTRWVGTALAICVFVLIIPVALFGWEMAKRSNLYAAHAKSRAMQDCDLVRSLWACKGMDAPFTCTADNPWGVYAEDWKVQQTMAPVTEQMLVTLMVPAPVSQTHFIETRSGTRFEQARLAGSGGADRRYGAQPMYQQYRNPKVGGSSAPTSAPATAPEPAAAAAPSSSFWSWFD